MSGHGSHERIDTASLVVTAAPAAVFSAFEDADALMAWLPPGGMHGRALEYTFRPGGAYAIELTYPDATPGKTSANADVSRGRFLVIDPPARLVQSVTFESDDAAFAGEMTMTWTFEPVDQGTRVTVAATNVPPGITAEDHAEGLAGSLENLRRYLAARR
jgi:uncharacterized protein YndB with AHSA1/START domain